MTVAQGERKWTESEPNTSTTRMTKVLPYIMLKQIPLAQGVGIDRYPAQASPPRTGTSDKAPHLRRLRGGDGSRTGGIWSKT